MNVVAEKYELLQPLDEGGFGEVYVARHLHTHATCAIKLLRLNPRADAAQIQRFSREARLPNTVDHPGVVKVFDAGVDPALGRLYLVMELLEGENLRKRMRAPAFSRTAARAIVLRMLEPLAAAHDRAIVHRDLKPENVFLARSPDGTERVVLLDFGLARRVGGSFATREGQMMGTDGYVSPEQTRDARSVKPTADVWSVGAMLYEIMCGDTPYRDYPRTSDRPHTPLREAAPGVDPRLADLVERCLSRDPARRPPDARALHDELCAIDGSASRLAYAPTSPAPVRASAAAPSVTAPARPAAERRAPAVRVLDEAPPRAPATREPYAAQGGYDTPEAYFAPKSAALAGRAAPVPVAPAPAAPPPYAAAPWAEPVPYGGRGGAAFDPRGRSNGVLIAGLLFGAAALVLAAVVVAVFALRGNGDRDHDRTRAAGSGHATAEPITPPAPTACCGGSRCAAPQTQGTFCARVAGGCARCPSGRDYVAGACADLLPPSHRWRVHLASVLLDDRALPAGEVCVRYPWEPRGANRCTTVGNGVPGRNVTSAMVITTGDILSSGRGLLVEVLQNGAPVASRVATIDDNKLSTSALCLGTALHADRAEVRIYLDDE
jgi:tRNA A-37 threonylcarbamoyl transferase component Bud32